MSSKTIETITTGESHSVAFAPPQWLDNTFLEEHLRNYYQNKEIQVVNFDVKPAVGKGENYFSCIYRVNVTLSSSGKDSTKDGDVSIDNASKVFIQKFKKYI